MWWSTFTHLPSECTPILSLCCCNLLSQVVVDLNGQLMSQWTTLSNIDVMKYLHPLAFRMHPHTFQSLSMKLCWIIVTCMVWLELFFLHICSRDFLDLTCTSCYWLLLLVLMSLKHTQKGLKRVYLYSEQQLSRLQSVSLLSMPVLLCV